MSSLKIPVLEIFGRIKALVLLLLIIVVFTAAEQTDIECLRSIKESLEDPLNYLESWQFDSNHYSLCSFRGVECWSADDNRILNISLSDMGLRGKFPLGLSLCIGVTGVDFSRNYLYGSIPRNISKIIPYATRIDLSFNTFSGEIPPDIANCSFVNVLNLNNNLLTGPIPQELALLGRLRAFSVANNNLWGPIPLFSYSQFSRESFDNNKGLCGIHLDPCREPSGPSHSKIDFVNGFLEGWAVFFVLFLLAGLFLPFERYLRKIFNTIGGIICPRQELLRSTISRDHNPKISMFEKLVPRMSLRELTEATDVFSQNYVITSGEFGTMYKGVLTNGSCISVKKLHHSLQQEREFLSEIITLSKIRHSNLMPLIGFCYESNERMLIHNFIPNGSLYDFLSKNRNSIISEWPVKLKVAVGLAKGISWLHLNGVIHRAINSKCVLLDQYFDPKISDFGRAAPITPSGQEQHLRDREFSVPECCYVEDVYGFGVVLLELITGKKLNDLMECFESIDGNNLVELTSYLLTSAEAIGLENEERTSRFLRIARTCLERKSRNAPRMLEVCQMLIGTTV